MITAEQLKQIFPACRDVQMWAKVLTPACKDFGIDTGPEFAEFIAQVGHESNQLNVLKENLSYSGRRLMQVWPKRFPTIEYANTFAFQPDKIANKVYADRLGNGNEESGDGFKYRGRGLIQITGRANYKACGEGLKQMLLTFPQKLEDPIYAARSAAWYWASRKLNEVIGDVEHDTRLVNGGLHGLDQREALYAKAKEVLGV